MNPERDLVVQAWLRRFPLDQRERYIHKYYLEPALKQQVHPADIGAIQGLDLEDAQREPGHGVLIQYQDLGAEKRLDPCTVAAVLAACSVYHQDCSAAPTPEEVEAILALNRRLEAIEQWVLQDCADLRDHVERDRYDDVEVTVRIDFYLRALDPQGGEDAVHDHDPDDDVTLMCRLRYCGGELLDRGPERFGFGDDRDHYALCESWPAQLHQDRHTWLLHELYEDVGIPVRHLGRIGRIAVDIMVQHQRSVD